MVSHDICCAQVAYVTIAGRYIKGARLTDGDATWGQKLAGAGYQQARRMRSFFWVVNLGSSFSECLVPFVKSKASVLTENAIDHLASYPSFPPNVM